LPEDMHGVFLMLARAAHDGAPCPSDAAVARAYGTHSAGRARRIIAYMEERGVIVCRNDFRNNRIMAFPDLGWETAPGDPNGPDLSAGSGAGASDSTPATGAA